MNNEQTAQPTIESRKTTPQTSTLDKERLATYAYLVFSLLTISLFGIFAILPAFSTISNLNKQFEDNKKVASALETKLSALASLDQEYKTLERDLPYIYNAVPSTAEIPTFVRQVETLAEDSGVNIQSLAVGTVEYFPLQTGTGDLFSYTFSLEASGQEENVNEFINGIISFNRVVSIDRITSGMTADNSFRTSIGGKVYFSKDAS